MDTGTKAATTPESEADAQRLKTSADASGGKGTMREPTQKPGQIPEGQEELKRALQEVEEEKGDWSKGG